MKAPEELSLDEIVARNVRRLRNDDDLTISTLATRLGVSRPQVYDMERPRPGRDQREFKWRELVALASAFGVTIFELVLPQEGVQLAEGDVILGIPRSDASIEDDSDAPYLAEIIDRDDVSLRLFGLPGNVTEPDTLIKLAAKIRNEKETRAAMLAEALEILLERMGEEE